MVDVCTKRVRIQCHALKQTVLTGIFDAEMRPEWLKTIGTFDESVVQTPRLIFLNVAAIQNNYNQQGVYAWQK